LCASFDVHLRLHLWCVCAAFALHLWCINGGFALRLRFISLIAYALLRRCLDPAFVRFFRSAFAAAFVVHLRCVCAVFRGLLMRCLDAA
jgi:hypothetical protein